LLAVFGVIWLLLPRGFPARWLGLCLLLPAAVLAGERPGARRRLGGCARCRPGPGGGRAHAEHTLLYDTGPLYSAESDAGQRIVVPYLRATGSSGLIR
jgi:competence protein ComEC